MDNVIRINTIEDYTDFFGCPAARHPLMSLCRLSDVKDFVSPGCPVELNLYTIVVKDGNTCTEQYGWHEYDFRRGALSFFAPGQLHRWGDARADASRWGWMLSFHPDFIRRYALGQRIKSLRFFGYETNEALHVSHSERQTIESLMENMEREYQRDIDEHTQGIIVSLIDVLMNYAERFYTRQFRTRQSVEPDILQRVREAINQHYAQRNASLITPRDIADRLCMSPHYLTDYLRTQTGQNTQQHIHAYLIDRAKHLLVTTDSPASEIAYRLGFEYPQHFARLFKQKTGLTPIEFRKAG